MTRNTPARVANRKPIEDVLGDPHSLGILLMDAEVLDRCRILSGAPTTYEYEYAVWYSAQDIYVNIGKQIFSITRPYAFYNINQVVSGASVEFEAEDKKMLNVINNELREKYLTGIGNSEAVHDYNNKVVSIIKKYYALNHFNHDVSDFKVPAIAELHVPYILGADLSQFTKEASDIVNSQLALLFDKVDKSSDEYVSLKEVYNEEEVGFMIEDETFELAINHVKELMKSDTFVYRPEVTEELINSKCIELAVLSLEDDYIIQGDIASMSEEQLKDIYDNNKMVYKWLNTSLHNFHAHPTGVNSFSGYPAGVNSSSPKIEGKSGDLMNKYEESWDATEQKWVQTVTSEAGIVYQFAEDVNFVPTPSYAGVVQQHNQATTLVFNELRYWRIKENAEKYTYARTPCLTYVKGFAPEVEHKPVPTLQSMLGYTEPEIPSHDYVVPFLGADTSDMTQEIFNAYLETPFEVLYDIDSDRVREEVYTNTYCGHYNRRNNTASAYKTVYPKKKGMIKYILDHSDLMEKQAKKTKKPVSTKKQLSRLNSKALQSKVDYIVVNTLFKNDNTTTRNIIELMNKVFNIFEVNLFTFVDDYQKTHKKSQPVVEFFANTKTALYQFERLHKSGMKLLDVAGMTDDEITTTVSASYQTTTTTSTTTKDNWPISPVLLKDALRDLHLSEVGTMNVTIRRYKEAIETMYGISTKEATQFWQNCELFDIDIFEFADELLLNTSMYVVEALSSWQLPTKTTDKLLEKYTTHELIWLEHIDLEKLLIEERSEGNLEFEKSKCGQPCQAAYLKTYGVNTIESSGIAYGVYSKVIEEEVKSTFASLVASNLHIAMPMVNIQDLVSVCKQLQINIAAVANKAEDVEGDSTLSELLRLNDEELKVLEEYVAPYTNKIEVLVSFAPEELTKWANKNVEVETPTVESLGVEINTLDYTTADALLLEFGVTAYTTTVGSNMMEVPLNTTNVNKAVTNLFIKTHCFDNTTEELVTIINNINRIQLPVDELMDEQQRVADIYIDMLIDFEMDDLSLQNLKATNGEWQDILCTVPAKKNTYVFEGDTHTGVPVISNTVPYKEVEGILIPISVEKYRALCEQMCVIEKLVVGGEVKAIVNSGFSITITTNKKVGEVLYPVTS